MPIADSILKDIWIDSEYIYSIDQASSSYKLPVYIKIVTFGYVKGFGWDIIF